MWRRRQRLDHPTAHGVRGGAPPGLATGATGRLSVTLSSHLWGWWDGMRRVSPQSTRRVRRQTQRLGARPVATVPHPVSDLPAHWSVACGLFLPDTRPSRAMAPGCVVGPITIAR